MKLVKKVLAVALTGAMALSMFAACDTSTLSSDKLVGAVNEKLGANQDSITISAEATAIAKNQASYDFALLEAYKEAENTLNEELDAATKTDPDEKAKAIAAAYAKYDAAVASAKSAVAFDSDGNFHVYSGILDATTKEKKYYYTLDGEDADVTLLADTIAQDIIYMRSKIASEAGLQVGYSPTTVNAEEPDYYIGIEGNLGSGVGNNSSLGERSYYINNIYRYIKMKSIDSIGYYSETRSGKTYVYIALGYTKKYEYVDPVEYDQFLSDDAYSYGETEEDDGILGNEGYTLPIV